MSATFGIKFSGGARLARKDVVAFNVVTTNPGEDWTLPLNPEGTYDFIVFWGDGQKDNITAYDQPEATHVYADAGTYKVVAFGEMT